MFGAAIKKDIQLVMRDMGALISLFALPIVFMAVFGSIFAGDAGAAGAAGGAGPAAGVMEVGGFQAAVPGNAVLFGFFLALIVAMSFVEERKSGTWQRLLAAPVSRPVVLVAKLVPYTFIGLVQFAFLFGVGAVVFGMEVAGSVAAFIILTCAVVVCATSLGLFIAAFGGNERQVGGIGSIVLLVMGLLGGAMVPRVAMPDTMQTLSLLVPHAWALDGYHALMVGGGTLADIWRELAALLGFAVAFAAIGAARFRFE